MADLTANDVAVVVQPSNREMAGAGAYKNMTLAQITFGDGAKNYPTGGVPLPDKSAFGLHKAIELALIEQPPGNGFIYKYDKANHKIRIYTQGVKTGATAAAVNEDGALPLNSAGAEATAPRFPKTAISSTYDLGPLIELPAAIAPAAVSIDMMLIGQ